MKISYVYDIRVDKDSYEMTANVLDLSSEMLFYVCIGYRGISSNMHGFNHCLPLRFSSLNRKKTAYLLERYPATRWFITE